MPILYMRPTCPYCREVLTAANRLGVAFDLKNIENPANLGELIARGGKQQVPYLVDTEKGVEMYGSDVIIAYLQKTYPAAAA